MQNKKFKIWNKLLEQQRQYMIKWDKIETKEDKVLQEHKIYIKQTMIKNKTNFFRIKNMALIIFLKIKAKIVIKKNYFNNYKRRINY